MKRRAFLTAVDNNIHRTALRTAADAVSPILGGHDATFA